jgi:hypothetical protein
MKNAKQTQPNEEQFLGLLEKKTELLDRLGNALRSARTDLAAFDLNAIEEGISEQERLCGQIRTLDAEVDIVQRRCAGLGQAGGKIEEERMRPVIERLARTQAEVQALNHSHEELLRKSRRTVNVLLNSFSAFAMTYAAPPQEANAGPGAVTR